MKSLKEQYEDINILIEKKNKELDIEHEKLADLYAMRSAIHKSLYDPCGILWEDNRAMHAKYCQ